MANPKYLLNRTGAEVDNILSSAESHVVDDSKHITSEERSKLAGIAEGANNYTHPDTHAATMITEDSTHRFVTDAEKAAWNAGIVQSDWNVNDESSSEYIKNRPFYTSDPVETYIVQNPSFSQSTTSDDGTVKHHIFSSLIELVVGTKYTVYFGSTSYECICSLIESASCLGNSSILGIGNNTGEPFFIYTDNSTQTIIATTDTSETPSVSISTIASEIVKIDEKYLPVSAFTNAEWDYISGKPIEDTVDINISVSNFTQTFDSITTGSVYSNKLFNEELLLESGYTYRVTGRISLVSEGIGNTYYLSIDDYFTCESNGYLNLGAIYCPFHKKELGIKLYGSNSYSDNNKLCFIGYNFTEKQTITVEELNIVSKTKTLDKKYIPNVFLFKDNPKCSGSFSLNRYPDSVVGSYSFAEGYMGKATGKYSHAEGNETEASGESSHAEGNETEASGKYSHAEGRWTIASSNYQHVQGRGNVPDDSNTYLQIVGNGRDFASRSNASTIDWSGNAWYAGDVYVGSTSGTNKDSGSKKLATADLTNIDNATFKSKVEASGFSSGAKVQILTWEETD